MIILVLRFMISYIKRHDFFIFCAIHAIVSNLVFFFWLNVLQSWIPSSSTEFTEEFDFEAMNDKFNKSELWGFLGKNNQVNHREETAVEPSDEGKAKVFISIFIKV